MSPEQRNDFADQYFKRYKYYEREENFDQALKLFQKEFGVPATGILDSFTIARMEENRCGVISHDEPSIAGAGDAWPHSDLKYFILNATPDLGFLNLSLDLADAFKIWESVTSLKFQRVSEASQAHFKISFSSGDHGDGLSFDGPGGTLAHAFYPPPNSRPGEIHFDESETWSRDIPVPNNGTDFMTVAIHEIGHALGLTHSSDPSSAMYPSYHGVFRALGQNDIERIQSLYPNCPPQPPPSLPPYEDPTNIALMNEWLQIVNGCYKRLEPLAYIDPWSRACGKHKKYIAYCKRPPDPYYWTSHRYLWYHNRYVRNYPHRVRQYVDLRKSGKSFNELNYCST